MRCGLRGFCHETPRTSIAAGKEPEGACTHRLTSRQAISFGLRAARAEHREHHGDLAGVVDDVFSGAAEERFIGVRAAGNLLRELLDGKIADTVLQSVAAAGPAREKLGPGNRRLRPFLVGFPFGHRVSGRSEADAFVPEQEVLQESGDGMSAREGRRGSEFGRRFRQQLREGWPIPAFFEGSVAIRVGDLVCGNHEYLDARSQRLAPVLLVSYPRNLGTGNRV